MDKKDFKNKLETMYDDVNFSNDQAINMLSLISDTTIDKEELLRNIYFSENSPLKVINYMFEPKRQGDSTGEMIRLSMNFDAFVNVMNDTAKGLINSHTEAVSIFLTILSLPSPYSLLLYLRYYKRMTNEDVRNRMFLSRTTYYRFYDKAINLCMKQYFKGEKV